MIKSSVTAKFSWYRNLPQRKRRALWWLLIGTALFIYGVLGLVGVFRAPL